MGQFRDENLQTITMRGARTTKRLTLLDGLYLGSNREISSASPSLTGSIRFHTTGQTLNTLIFLTGTDANHIILAEIGDVNFDFEHTQQTNPTMFIHSANQSTTEWISFTHNQTDGVIQTGAGNLTIGNGADSQGLTTPNDLFVTGKLEVDGDIFVDSELVCGNNVELSSATPGSTGTIRMVNDQQTLNTMTIHTGTLANSILIIERDDRNFDFEHTLQTNPTLFIHSANQSTTEWVGITHDQTDGVITTGVGDLLFDPATNVKTAADVDINMSNGGRLYGGGIQANHQTLAANTNLTLDENDSLVEVTSGNASDNTITLPTAQDNLGMIISIYFVVDGTKNVIITRAGADVIQNGSADLGNTTVTLNDAGDYVVLQSVANAMWQVVVNNGGAVA